MSHGPSSKDHPFEVLPAQWWQRLGHDLRGPIAPMRMAVQLLKSGRVGAAEQEAALQLIDRQIDVLLASIEDLTDLLRLNSGTFALNSAPNDLNLVLDVVSGRASLLRTLGEKQQALRCDPAEEAVIADHDALQVAALLEYLIRKSAEHAAPGALLTLELRKDGGRALLRICGSGRSLGVDPDVRHVTGVAVGLIGEREVKPVLMREIARLNGIEFSPIDEATGLSFWLPA